MKEQWVEDLAHKAGVDPPVTIWGSPEPKRRRKAVRYAFKRCPKCGSIHALTAPLCHCGNPLKVRHEDGTITKDGVFIRPQPIGGYPVQPGKSWFSSKLIWTGVLLLVTALLEWAGMIEDPNVKATLTAIFGMLVMFLRAKTSEPVAGTKTSKKKE